MQAPPPPFKATDSANHKDTFTSAAQELEELRPAKDESIAFWINGAIIVTWATIIIAIVYSGVALGAGIKVKSTSMVAYALETLVDAISSLFVVWRFWGYWGKEALPPHDRRDQQASVLISVFFVLLAIFILGISIEQLASKDKPEKSIWIIVLAALGLILGIVFSVAKFVTAYYTNSTVLMKDGWASAAGAVLSLGTLISYYAYLHAPSQPWWIDGTVALVIGFLLLCYGVWGLAEEPWWSPQFWQGADAPSSAPDARGNGHQSSSHNNMRREGLTADSDHSDHSDHV